MKETNSWEWPYPCPFLLAYARWEACHTRKMPCRQWGLNPWSIDCRSKLFNNWAILDPLADHVKEKDSCWVYMWMSVDETLRRWFTQWLWTKIVWQHPASNRDWHDIFIRCSSRFVRELLQGNLQWVMPITALTDMREVSSDIRTVSTLDRQSLAAAPYGLFYRPKSFVDEHPCINPAIVFIILITAVNHPISTWVVWRAVLIIDAGAFVLTFVDLPELNRLWNSL